LARCSGARRGPIFDLRVALIKKNFEQQPKQGVRAPNEIGFEPAQQLASNLELGEALQRFEIIDFRLGQMELPDR